MGRRYTWPIRVDARHTGGDPVPSSTPSAMRRGASKIFRHTSGPTSRTSSTGVGGREIGHGWSHYDATPAGWLLRGRGFLVRLGRGAVPLWQCQIWTGHGGTE